MNRSTVNEYSPPIPIPEVFQPVGNHPETGEPLLYVLKFVSESNDELVTVNRCEPERPTRLYSEWDGDDYLEQHERTDEELAEALAEYEAAHAQWVKDGRPNGPTPYLVKGAPPTITAAFATAAGDVCSGFKTEDGWHMVSWETRPKR